MGGYFKLCSGMTQTRLCIILRTMSIYLDWAATAVPDPDIIKASEECALRFFGNPSSVHKAGQESSAVLEECRTRCAKVLGVKREEVFFTSGGTESDNIVLLSLLRKPSRGTVLVSAIEHPAVLEPATVLAENGYKVAYLKPGADGIIRKETLIKTLSPDTKMVTVMAVNNETGAVQPVHELAQAVQQYARECGHKIHFHCDSVQGTGKVKLDFGDPAIHSFAISGHKIRGPRGVGILILKSTIQPMVRGGGQENGIRPGTENTAAIYGMTLALEKAVADLDKNSLHAYHLMDTLLKALSKRPEYQIIPENRKPGDINYSPYILSLAATPIPAEVLARTLDDRGICTGTGSACSNRKKGQSRTLAAMGVSDTVSFSRIRISIGSTTTEDDIEEFIRTLNQESGILLKTLR